MSHVASIELEITDLAALAAAADELGLEFVEGKKTYRWYGRWVQDYHGEDAAYKHGIDPKDYGKCDHVLRLKDKPEAYEVGVVRQGNKYVLIYDFYGPGHWLREKLGASGEKLLQPYAKHVAVNKLTKKGFKVHTVTQTEDNKLKIVMRT